MTDQARQGEVLSNKEREAIIAPASVIAATLQEQCSPERALQILSIALGMTLCACVTKRQYVKETMDGINEQVDIWCDFEEKEKTASWLKMN